MTTEATKIAQTIVEQLGGRRFIVMTGARNFVTLASGRGVAFKLPSYFARDGINAVRITLEPSDLYTVEFSKVRGLKLTPVSKHEGIYWDGLAPLFSKATGLATSL